MKKLLMILVMVSWCSVGFAEDSYSILEKWENERKTEELKLKNNELELRIENLENKSKKCDFRGRDLYGNCHGFKTSTF